jgi:hypothetical protein
MPDAYKNMFEQAFGKVSEVIDVPVGPIESPDDQPVLAGTEMEKHDLSD